MKDQICAIVFTVIMGVIVLFCLAGCTSTITHYDGNGNITKVEKVTNASRFYDGTNQSLTCAHCQEKLCHHKKQLRQFAKFRR